VSGSNSAPSSAYFLLIRLASGVLHTTSSPQCAAWRRRALPILRHDRVATYGGGLNRELDSRDFERPPAVFPEPTTCHVVLAVALWALGNAKPMPSAPITSAFHNSSTRGWARCQLRVHILRGEAQKHSESFRALYALAVAVPPCGERVFESDERGSSSQPNMCAAGGREYLAAVSN
jgi:hypothetical protein